MWKDYEQARDEMLTELGGLSLTLKRRPEHKERVAQRLEALNKQVNKLRQESKTNFFLMIEMDIGLGPQ